MITSSVRPGQIWKLNNRNTRYRVLKIESGWVWLEGELFNPAAIQAKLLFDLKSFSVWKLVQDVELGEGERP